MSQRFFKRVVPNDLESIAVAAEFDAEPEEFRCQYCAGWFEVSAEQDPNCCPSCFRQMNGLLDFAADLARTVAHQEEAA